MDNGMLAIHFLCSHNQWVCFQFLQAIKRAKTRIPSLTLPFPIGGRGPKHDHSQSQIRWGNKGIKVSATEEVTHTLFVDDVLLFGEGSIRNLEDFLALIDKYSNGTRMVVNVENSNLIHNEFP